MNKKKKDNKRENIVMAPTAMSSQYRNDPATLNYSTKGDGSVRIRHREYVQDIVPQIASFSVTKLPINPGVGSIFYWLQSIALNYESYVFNSLSFEFESSASTSDRGTLLMGIDFDAADPSPVTKQEMMAFNGSVRTNLWAHSCCRASSQDLRKFGVQRYIRGVSALAANEDIKTYDVGNFYIATQGVQTGVTFGELYVTYDVTLHTPQPGGGQILLANTALVHTLGNQTSSSPLGTGITVRGGLLARYRTGTTMFIDTIGSFIVNIEFIGTGLDDTDPFSVTCPFGGSIIWNQGWKSNASTTAANDTFILETNTIGAYIQIGATGISTLTAVNFRFAPYPASLAV